MSYLIIVGFDRQTNEAITESQLIQKLIVSICRSKELEICQWLKSDFGFFNEDKYKEQIEEMYHLLATNIPSMSLDHNKTAWLKEYWMVDCLYSALSKCFPLLGFQEITTYQERWLDAVYSGQKPTQKLHPGLGQKGHAHMNCSSCQKVTIPFKVRVTIPDLPLPKTPNYCPECYEKDKILYYVGLDGQNCQFKQNIKVHKL